MPSLGTGLGLRSKHYKDVLEGSPSVDWFEALTENYIGLEGIGAGRPLHILERVRERFPVVLHGVSLSIGSTDPLNLDYLTRLKALINRVQPEWISDHICWTGVGGINLHDLLPLPYTQETLDHLIERLDQVQTFLGREILLENVSSYLTYRDSEMTEWEFVRELANRSGCDLLLDVNNVYVSSINHQFDPLTYLRALPHKKIRQIHLAGHTWQGPIIIDTHEGVVSDPVWSLYQEATRHLGEIPTMIEWDQEIPDYLTVEAEALKAKALQRKVLDENRIQAPRASVPVQSIDLGK